MRQVLTNWLIVSVAALSLVSCVRTPGFDSEKEAAVREGILAIEQSHIDGNVPAPKDFQSFLIRDLQKHFSSLLKKKVRVEYELLRDGPTQVGIAYPKYYAWVKIYGTGASQSSKGRCE